MRDSGYGTRARRWWFVGAMKWFGGEMRGMEFDFGTTNVVRGVGEDEDEGDAGVRRNAEECTLFKPVDAERGRVCCG